MESSITAPEIRNEAGAPNAPYERAELGAKPRPRSRPGWNVGEGEKPKVQVPGLGRLETGRLVWRSREHPDSVKSPEPPTEAPVPPALSGRLQGRPAGFWARS